MSIKRLLNKTCQYEELVDSATNEYGLEYRNYKSPETIKCFLFDNASTFGRITFDIKENGRIINNSTKCYNVIDQRVKEGDRIDGRLVVSIDTCYTFLGKFHHKVCSVI